jgi:hypothetical protein
MYCNTYIIQGIYCADFGMLLKIVINGCLALWRRAWRFLLINKKAIKINGLTIVKAHISAINTHAKKGANKINGKYFMG